jgi:hypothetical protein
MSMRRYLVVLIAVFALVLPAASPAGAVTDGAADGYAHPYVGLVVFYDAGGNPTHRCSGTLLSPTVFLTAGHCTEGASSAQVWFEPDVTADLGYPYEGGTTGTPYTHPDFVWSIPNTSDLGVVVLDEGVYLDTYGVVADAGTLDALATQRGRRETRFTVVGYGLQEIRPQVLSERTRLQASVRLVNLRSALTDGYNIHHTNAQGTGGGTCFGDSGGPVFQGDSNVIVGVTSFGLNANCVGGGFAYRTDIATSQNFIYSFF